MSLLKATNLCLRFDEYYMKMHRYFIHFTYLSFTNLIQFLIVIFMNIKYFFLSDWLKSNPLGKATQANT